MKRRKVGVSGLLCDPKSCWKNGRSGEQVHQLEASAILLMCILPMSSVSEVHLARPSISTLVVVVLPQQPSILEKLRCEKRVSHARFTPAKVTILLLGFAFTCPAQPWNSQITRDVTPRCIKRKVRRNTVYFLCFQPFNFQRIFFNFWFLALLRFWAIFFFVCDFMAILKNLWLFSAFVLQVFRILIMQ